jgi:molybdopterin converting factor small subunit
MKISVKFLSQLRVLAGTDEAVIELPEGATVAELFGSLRQSFPALFPIAEHTVVMVSKKIATPQTVLHDGDQVMLLQLLGGG